MPDASDNSNRTSPVIGVVGPCAAGKSTLIAGLKAHGFENVRHIAQEHSYVADMWQRLVHPDILIYLNVSYTLTVQRRRMDWTESEYAEQIHRLRHARQHATLFIQTDLLTPQEVLQQALDYLT
jgi:deoxyadenosine/deoxycytidine kinase